LHRTLAGPFLSVCLGAALPGVLWPQSLSPPEPSAPPPHRGADGRLELTAVMTAAPVRVDGVLDDAVWATATPVGHFVQAEPDEGQPATAATLVRVAYDASYVYVAAMCYDDPRAVVITDIRKDFNRENQDGFEVIFDTFGDRRNGYLFATNPAGARFDEQVTNEGRDENSSWNAPWTVRTRRVAGGWTVEMAIPRQSLRAREDGGMWGINFSRRIRRHNEVAYWAPVPRAYALSRLSLAGNLAGLSTARGARDMRLTPHVAAETVRDTGRTAFDHRADVGVDAKIGVTNGLTLDLTANPDFAQSEADEQQVNLTQFSQYFPEKRDFFLENAGMFYLGDTPRNRRVGTMPSVDEDLLLFFSRRMGLSDDGRRIGIDGGLRLTGQQGGFQIGALALRTRALDSLHGSDYAVVRLRHNLFSASDVGAIFMLRSAVGQRSDYNRVYGVDANIRLPARVDWSSYVVNTDTPGLTGPAYAWYSSLNREADFVHTKAGVMSIGEDFNDEFGFFRRTGVMKWLLDAGIRPRFASLRRLGVREMHPHVVWNYYTDHGLRRVAQNLHNGYTFFLNNGGYTEFSVNVKNELLTDTFTLDPHVDVLQPAAYRWIEYQWRLTSDESRALSVSLSGIVGGLWDGTQRTVGATVSARPSCRIGASLGLQWTSARLPGGQFVRAIWTARGNYSFSTNMFLDALAQYDAEQDLLNVNVRFNLIHHALSNLYLVWNEQRFTTDFPLGHPGGAPRAGRSLVLKVTQMVAP
jgi:hypothetical protein